MEMNDGNSERRGLNVKKEKEKELTFVNQFSFDIFGWSDVFLDP